MFFILPKPSPVTTVLQVTAIREEASIITGEPEFKKVEKIKLSVMRNYS